MSYVSFVIILQMTHKMHMRLKYDIIWSILVSKQLCGPRQSHLLIRIWPTNCLKIKKIENCVWIFSQYKFWKSFVYFDQTRGQIWSYFRNSYELNLFVNPNRIFSHKCSPMMILNADFSTSARLGWSGYYASKYSWLL